MWVIGATEADAVAEAHVDVHGCSASRTSGSGVLAESLELDTELTIADFAQEPRLAGGRFPVPVISVRSAPGALQPAGIMAMHLRLPVPAGETVHAGDYRNG